MRVWRVKVREYRVRVEGEGVVESEGEDLEC